MFLAGRSESESLVLNTPHPSRWGWFPLPQHTRVPLGAILECPLGSSHTWNQQAAHCDLGPQGVWRCA